MEKKMEINIMGYKGTTIRIPFFIKRQLFAKGGMLCVWRIRRT